MFEWFKNLEVTQQTMILSSTIGAIISFIIYVLGSVYEPFKKIFFINYSIKKEYENEQKKKLKEEIAQNKMNLLNSAEKLNHRLWNFAQHPKKLETEKKYYQNSFIKLVLNLLSISDTIENEIKTIDSSNGTKEDQNFLKYVKVFKDILTDKDLFRGFINPYCPKGDFNKKTYHQRKSDLQELIISYKKTNGKKKNKKFNQLFSKININSPYSDPTINVFKTFHIILINFLNSYGLDYQKTEKDKMIKITRLYRHGMKSTKPLKDFLQKSKLSNEFKHIFKSL